MDVVLEIWDNYFADYIFAAAFPAKNDLYNFSYDGLSNHTAAQVLPPWQYTPATQYWSLEPPQAAYMTAVTRDNVWRQLASLYTITVYVL